MSSYASPMEVVRCCRERKVRTGILAIWLLPRSTWNPRGSGIQGTAGVAARCTVPPFNLEFPERESKEPQDRPKGKNNARALEEFSSFYGGSNSIG